MTDSPDDYMAWLAGHEAWAERIDQENRGIPWTDGPEPDWDATETQRGRRADLGEGFPPIAALRAAERETGSLWARSFRRSTISGAPRSPRAKRPTPNTTSRQLNAIRPKRRIWPGWTGSPPRNRRPDSERAHGQGHRE